MDWNTPLLSRINLGGFCVAATYVLVVLVAFVLTAATTSPYKVGLDWIPLILLCMPWYGLHPVLLIPGFVINVTLLYLVVRCSRGSGLAWS